MLKIRVIPVLLLKNGLLVRSESFARHQYIGDPYHEVIRFNEWNVDEIIYLDIGDKGIRSPGRLDSKIKHQDTIEKILPAVATNCFVPLTFGGGIKTISEIRTRLVLGADKVTLNTGAVVAPNLITTAAQNFGSQCIVICIDAYRHSNGMYEVYVDGGKTATGLDVLTWAREVERLGAGEILLQSIRQDGSATGFDCTLIKKVVEGVSIPVIALGGAGAYSDFVKVVQDTGVTAVAAANLFHFKELADRHIKRQMKLAGLEIRET
jgi:cyclase